MSVQAKIDKAVGDVKKTAGEAVEKLGDKTGSVKLQNEGQSKQVEGLAQKAKGHVEDAWDTTKQAVKKATNN